MKKYGILIEDCQLKNLVGRYWTLIVLVRWTLTIIILIVLRDYFIFQIYLLLLISVFISIIMMYSQPFSEKKENHFTFFNELMTSFYLYIMLCLTDFHGKNKFRAELGWVLLAIAIFTVIVNLIKAAIFDFI